MSDAASAAQVGVVISTSAVALVTGFLLGLYSTRGYLIPPEATAARRAVLADPEESDEADVDDADAGAGGLLDHAPDWHDATRPSPQPAPAPAPTEECKLVLVVRTDLGMGRGKIGAQCGHATLACYQTISRAAGRSPGSTAARHLRQWERLGQTKIAVQGKDEAELVELMGRARSLDIVAEIVADAGRTQIDAGTLTVLGIGPAPKSLVDRVTGHLKLL